MNTDSTLVKIFDKSNLVAITPTVMLYIEILMREFDRSHTDAGGTAKLTISLEKA